MDALETYLASLDPVQAAYLDWQRRWGQTARATQVIPDGEWTEYGVMAGRGFGKTRVGAEWLGRSVYERSNGLPAYVVAPTQADVRFVCFEGESGLLNVVPSDLVVKYNASDLILTLRCVNGGESVIRGFSAEKGDRLRGPQGCLAWCFVADTMVATPVGERPIEALRPGDLVLTRKGPRRVLANSAREADVGRVDFSHGRFLVGTTDHPVYTSNGWTDLSKLSEEDELCVMPVSSGEAGAGTAIVGGTTSGRTRAFALSVLAACTSWFGRAPTGLRPRATSSITATATDLTTPRTTLSCSTTERTASTTPAARSGSLNTCATNRWLRCLARSAARLFSANTQPALSAVGAPSAGVTRSATRPRERAATAVRLSSLAPATSAASVVSTWRPTGRRSVYCLKVEGEPEYFANGVLVHNCDEIAAWGPQAQPTWDNMQMGLRLGPNPQALWTSTPRATPFVRTLIAPREGRIVVRGTTFDNRANLPKSFFQQLEQYEGTKIGRQELYGELIDPEESGIVRRSQFNLWPANKPLPVLDYIVMSLDTAYTEATRDKKSGDADPTACVVLGLFKIKSVAHVIVLDCWQDHLGLPDLISRVKRERQTRYGDDQDAALIRPMFGNSKPVTSGRAIDMILIEDKGSGISLRQMLNQSGIESYAYNPGRADKLARLHIVSPIFAQHRVWLPESDRTPGKPRTWTDDMVSQLCSFTGEGSVQHDDYVDATTQALRVLTDQGLMSMTKPTRDEKREAEYEEHRASEPIENPYAA